MARIVEPEWLDQLPADNPQAVRSRRDLERINWLMNHRRIIGSELARLPVRGPVRIAELGAGDGTFLLGVARLLANHWPHVEAALVDQQNLVSPKTRDSFQSLGWNVEIAESDVFEWLSAASGPARDIVLSNLFVHHLPETSLQELFRWVTTRANLFIACEPRRSRLALLASNLLRLIGCNAVTRHDAVISVRAGFQNGELGQLWPLVEGWELTERSAGWVSHLFTAKRVPRIQP